GSETTTMDVRWAGRHLATITSNSAGASDALLGWQHHVFPVQASQASSRLEFVSLGPDGNCGPILDAVVVRPVAGSGSTKCDATPADYADGLSVGRDYHAAFASHDDAKMRADLETAIRETR